MMMRFSLLCLLLILTLVTVAKAQDSEMPPCATAELAAIRDGSDAAIDLLKSAREIRSLDDLLAYSHAHIEWRESAWSVSPLCAPAYEIAMLAEQLVSDYVPLIILNSYPGESLENPYRAGQDGGALRLKSFMISLPSSANTADAPPARPLRECSRVEYEFVAHSLAPEYGSLADIANAIETPADYLGFVEALLRWRQDSLPRYPACAQAIEYAWLASRTAADISALFAVDFLRVPLEANPYNEPERRGTRRLGELTDALRAGALPDEVKQAIKLELGNPGGGNWRRCSVEELETIQNLLPEYQMLENLAADIETLDNLVAYSQKQITWRENLLTELARCGEVLEIAWLISENIGDLAIMFGLEFLEIPVDESPVYQQVMSNIPGIITWEQLLPSLLANYEKTRVDGALPACTGEELGTLKTILSAHLSIFKDHGDLRSIDDLLSFVIQKLAWREFSFSRLPLCYGSLETFLRAYWFASDNAVGIALALAGVSDEANPYSEQQSHGKSYIERWYTIVDGVVDAPSPDTASTESK